MAIRRLLRGQLSDEAVESVVEAVAERYDLPADRVTFLEADNWLSTPLVVDEQFFVKVVTERHTLLHGLLTAGRNLGAFSSGSEGFFEHFDSPVEMAEHELAATERMRDLGLSAPEPIEAFEVDGFGVLVLEYLPDFQSLDQLDPETVGTHAPALFAALATMHENGLVHGDLRAENVLVANDELYFIDATNVRGDGLADGRAYDLACALGALAPHVGARAAVEAALTAYSAEELLEARDFLDFVNIRPDHSFDAAAVKGEIEKEAT
ncbi:RIO1 family regulatory kinase/ATPase [Halorientalis halophila]|uniref:RIO1 family regulatory kinase/ATPase domain-containing protein n=1 Tax=Halorientalis halophila TaxID=3108499 RepID=UPI0030090FE0